MLAAGGAVLQVFAEQMATALELFFFLERAAPLARCS